MHTNLKEKIDLFATNRNSIRNDFIWQDAATKRLAALLYTIENKEIDCDAIRQCHELIKKNTSVFSAFRGNLAICTAALLSLSEDREGRFSDTLDVYGMMKETKFKASDFLVMAAYQIASNTDRAKFRHTVDRAKLFYDGMKENHWFYTGADDYIFAAMLGLSDIEMQAGVERMEQLYTRLKSEFNYRNSIQTLTQVLVLGGETDETVPRMLALSELLRGKKVRLDKEYTLSVLGVLSLLPVDVNTVADDVAESYEILRTQKGLGKWSVSKQELLLFSAAIVASVTVDGAKSNVLTSTLSTSITNIIIAQQVVLAAAIASSSAATAAASSSH